MGMKGSSGTWPRREFLRRGGSLAALAALGFETHTTRASESSSRIAFVEEGGSPIGELTPGSHKGRLVVDLAGITKGTRITPNDEFFIRTRYPDLFVAPDHWEIEIGGAVERTGRLSLDELVGDVSPMGVQLLECSGNSKFRKFGLLSAAEWSGIPMMHVMDLCRSRFGVRPEATRLVVEGVDEHSDFATKRVQGASWIFGLSELEAAGAYLATEMNGRPLPRDHGAPVRLIMPNWYGCSNIKWVRALRFVDEDAPSTAQMREFASRTHQQGVPELAREFRPATMDFSAIVTRVTRTHRGEDLVYRLSGITWGGTTRVDELRIRFEDGGDSQRIDRFDHDQPSGFSFWEHEWRPGRPGRYAIGLSVGDPAVPTIRLDAGRYVRQVDIDEI